jgi:hypothetical protein
MAWVGGIWKTTNVRPESICLETRFPGGRLNLLHDRHGFLHFFQDGFEFGFRLAKGAGIPVINDDRLRMVFTRFHFCSFLFCRGDAEQCQRRYPRALRSCGEPILTTPDRPCWRSARPGEWRFPGD